jgi:hypothetical protein
MSDQAAQVARVVRVDFAAALAARVGVGGRVDRAGREAPVVSARAVGRAVPVARMQRPARKLARR